MRFWDASAIVPLCCQQPASHLVESIAYRDGELVVWWASPVECASALARLRREGGLSTRGLMEALSALTALRSSWTEVLAGEMVRGHAERLVHVHPLRAADALQLGSALVWALSEPSGLTVVSLDDRLRAVALLEGFTVAP